MEMSLTAISTAILSRPKTASWDKAGRANGSNNFFSALRETMQGSRKNLPFARRQSSRGNPPLPGRPTDKLTGRPADVLGNRAKGGPPARWKENSDERLECLTGMIPPVKDPAGGFVQTASPTQTTGPKGEAVTAVGAAIDVDLPVMPCLATRGEAVSSAMFAAEAEGVDSDLEVTGISFSNDDGALPPGVSCLLSGQAAERPEPPAEQSHPTANRDVRLTARTLSEEAPAEPLPELTEENRIDLTEAPFFEPGGTIGGTMPPEIDRTRPALQSNPRKKPSDPAAAIGGKNLDRGGAGSSSHRVADENSSPQGSKSLSPQGKMEAPGPATSLREEPLLPAVGSGTAAAPPFPPNTAKSNLLDQLQGKLIYLQEQGDFPAEIRVKLDPPQLGEILIRVISRQGKLSAQIVAEAASVKEMLSSSLSDLQQRLQLIDLELEQIDLLTRGEMPSGTGGFSRSGFGRERAAGERVDVPSRGGALPGLSLPERTPDTHQGTVNYWA